jgi:hypoxanthine phosphoribosyltransferase
MEDEKFKCKVVSWNEITNWGDSVSSKITMSGWRPDVVIGLIRGGLVPARILCDHLQIKSLYAVKVEHWGITAHPDQKAKLVQGIDLDLADQKVLIVDDITDTGESMHLASEHISEKGPAEVKSATLLHIEHSVFEPDFYDVFVSKNDWTWFIFPWNFHEDLRTLIPKTLSCCRDIEGIQSALRDQFQIAIKNDTIQKTMKQLEEMDKVIQKPEGWEKKE